jgi:hypothetical protein
MLTHRFRSGLVQLVRFHVAAETVIEAGDLLWQDLGYVRPASEFQWTTDIATTRAAFAAAFAGIAHTPSAEGETTDVSVDISPLAVYEMTAVPASFEIGEALAPAETSSALSSRTLERVANPAHAIARSVENSAGVSAVVRAAFASAIHPGSANVNAALG